MNLFRRHNQPDPRRFECECLDCNKRIIADGATLMWFHRKHLTCQLRVTNLTKFAEAAATMVAEAEQFLGVTK